jgi:hypothetical protein
MYFDYLKYTSKCVDGTYNFVPVTLYLIHKMEVLLILMETQSQGPQNIVFHLILIDILLLKFICLYANAHYSPLLTHK